METFLVYGIEAAEVDAEVLDYGVTQSPATAAPAANAATAPPAVVPPATPALVEPDPDLRSGMGYTVNGQLLGDGLGDDLYLEETPGAPLFGPSQDPVTTNDVRQGFFDNCALPASLAAMAHVPLGKTKLQQMIKEIKAPIVSERERKASEYFVGQAPTPAQLKHKLQFTSTRSFDVTFGRSVAGTKTVRVTPQLYRNRKYHDKLRYTYSFQGALWPSLIEKAYAVAASGKSGPSYNVFLDDLKTHEVLGDLWGNARTDLLADTTKEALIAILKRHGQAPILLASDPAAVSPVVAEHAYAVVGYGSGQVTLFDSLGDPAQNDGPLLITLTVDNVRKEFTHVTYGQ